MKTKAKTDVVKTLKIIICDFITRVYCRANESRWVSSLSLMISLAFCKCFTSLWPVCPAQKTKILTINVKYYLKVVSHGITYAIKITTVCIITTCITPPLFFLIVTSTFICYTIFWSVLAETDQKIVTTESNCWNKRWNSGNPEILGYFQFKKLNHINTINIIMRKIINVEN